MNFKDLEHLDYIVVPMYYLWSIYDNCDLWSTESGDICGVKLFYVYL